MNYEKQNYETKIRFSGLMLAVQIEFEEKLKEKTGWGRNEILDAFKQSIINVLAKLQDK